MILSGICKRGLKKKLANLSKNLTLLCNLHAAVRWAFSRKLILLPFILSLLGIIIF